MTGLEKISNIRRYLFTQNGNFSREHSLLLSLACTMLAPVVFPTTKPKKKCELCGK